MQVGPGNVLRGQQQEEEEGQVGRRVTDELDEGLLDEAPQSALWSQQVDLTRVRHKFTHHSFRFLTVLVYLSFLNRK